MWCKSTGVANEVGCKILVFSSHHHAWMRHFDSNAKEAESGGKSRQIRRPISPGLLLSPHAGKCFRKSHRSFRAVKDAEHID
jgi:hypothetical protein